MTYFLILTTLNSINLTLTSLHGLSLYLYTTINIISIIFLLYVLCDLIKLFLYNKFVEYNYKKISRQMKVAYDCRWEDRIQTRFDQIEGE